VAVGGAEEESDGGALVGEFTFEHALNKQEQRRTNARQSRETRFTLVIEICTPS